MNQEILTSPAFINAIVPITRLNRGEANKVFEEVAECGFKIVVKNNKPICVLLSPERYETIMNLLAEQERILEANELGR